MRSPELVDRIDDNRGGMSVCIYFLFLNPESLLPIDYGQRKREKNRVNGKVTDGVWIINEFQFGITKTASPTLTSLSLNFRNCFLLFRRKQ